MGFAAQDDGNYTSWREPLFTKVDKWCSDRTFSVPSMKIGKQLYDYSFKEAASTSVVNFLHHTESLGSYLGQRPGVIVMIVFGLIILGISIFASLSIKPKIRNFWTKRFCGSCRPRSRPRMGDVEPRFRFELTLVSVGVGLLTVILSVFAMTVSAQIVQGVRGFNCGMWGQVTGHFFGAREFSTGEVPELATQWVGTINMTKQLADLKVKVTPGDTNPLYVALYDGFNDMKEKSTNLATNLDAMIAEAQTINAESVWVLENVTKADWRGRKLSQGMNGTIYMKGNVFRDELWTTLDSGFTKTIELVEKYAGKDSLLLGKAYQAVLDTEASIAQIDAGLAGIASLLDSLGPLLTALFLLGASLDFVFVATVIFASVCFLIIAWKLSKRLKHDRMASAKTRKHWALTFSILATSAGLAALLSAVFFALGIVGRDACYGLDDSLFVRGEWEIFGDKILYPLDNMTLDMRVVFDTCVRQDGGGDIPVALALDGRIAELSDDVERAKADVIATREAVLRRNEMTTRVRTLGLALTENFNSHFHNLEGGLPIVGGEDSYNDDFSPATSVGWTVRENYKKTGPNNLVCLIPIVNSPFPAVLRALAYGCQDITHRTALFNQAIDMANEVAAAASAAGDTNMPKAFCTQILKDVFNHDCGTINGVTMLDDTTTTENIETWTSTLDTKLANQKVLGASGNFSTRTQNLLNAIASLQVIGSKKIGEDILESKQKPASVLCPNNADDCTYFEMLTTSVTDSMARNATLVDGFLELVGFTDDYTNNQVIPMMSDLVNDANKLTDGSNCQFEGTALKEVALASLCESAASGALANAVIHASLFVLLGIAAAYAWSWYVFQEDLAVDFRDNQDQYDQPAFTPMSTRKAYVAYTGYGSGEVQERPRAAQPESNTPPTQDGQSTYRKETDFDTHQG